MKKSVLIVGILLAAVLVVGAVGAGIAFAQTSTPDPNTYPGGRMGRQGGGMMGKYGQAGERPEWMQAFHNWMVENGDMRTSVWNALAEKFGLTSEALQTELQSGKTLAQVAEAQGVSREDALATIEQAHQDFLAQAVQAGVLTQEQADTMLAQMSGRYEAMLDGYGRGMMGGGRGGYGGGYGGGHGGGMYGSGTCPNTPDGSTSTQPEL
jgi:hypothetical protein